MQPPAQVLVSFHKGNDLGLPVIVTEFSQGLQVMRKKKSRE